jgi:hypothetical protein
LAACRVSTNGALKSVSSFRPSASMRPTPDSASMLRFHRRTRSSRSTTISPSVSDSTTLSLNCRRRSISFAFALS